MTFFGFRQVALLSFLRACLSLALPLGQPILAETAALGAQKHPNSESFQIPVGTTLPARLNHGLSSRSAQPGQAVSARIMQEVPLPNRETIPEGAKLLGTIVSVERAGNSSGGKITFRFDTLEFHHRVIPVVVSLRALAGFMEVQSAETPEFGLDFGTPYVWANTRQIGGDQVYGVGGPVTNQSNERIGKGVYGGVLVHVRAQPESGCRGALDSEDRLQALWVFSSDACGVYGIPGVKIAQAGRTEPVGEITLLADQQDLLVRGASGILLRVVR